MLARLSLILVGITFFVVLTATTGPARADLVGLWAFDETSGTVAADTSGYAADPRHGTLKGTTGYLPSFAHTHGGKIGNSLRFLTSPVNQVSYVEVSNSPNRFGSMNNFTATGWIYLPTAFNGSPTGSYRNQKLFQLWNTTVGWLGYVNWPAGNPSQNVVLMTVANDGAANCSYHSPLLDRDVWNHIAYTYDGTTQRIFVNGELKASKVYVINVGTDPLLFMGGKVGEASSSVRGYLDDMGIWNEYLGETKIKALYNTPMIPELNTASTGRYGQKDMQDLFRLYDLPEHTPVTIGDKTWYYFASLPDPQGAGKAWHSGGEFFIQLGADGSGVSTIPEPSTMMLLACGLVGLLCYAWRKRR